MHRLEPLRTLLSRPAVRWLSILFAGGLGVLAFAPFGYWPFFLLSLVWLYHQLQGRSPGQGFLLGWAFGLGLLGFGVSWIRISLNEFGNLPPWAASGLMVLFLLAMALYYGGLGATTAWLSRKRPLIGALCFFPGLWVLWEWVRGWWFTGFPWLNGGDTQIDGPLAGFAPVLGIYGLSLLLALSAGLLWTFFQVQQPKPRFLVALVLGGLWLGGPLLGRWDWTQADGPPLRVALLQGNSKPAIKWKPEAKASILRTYVELTRASYGSQVIVWPETAIPDFLFRVRKPFLEPLRREALAQKADLVIGIPFLDQEQGRYYNGLLSLRTWERYAKRHLVPFGEFTPFKAWLGSLAKAFSVPMSDFSSGEAERPLLRVGAQRVGVSICYEDAFPAELLPALPDARYLINVSNDAWFGDSLAPHQHLAIARMRALETGRWLVRATNTGISALLNHRGQVVARLPSFTRGSLQGEIQPRKGATPFVGWGNGMALGLACLLILLGFRFSAKG